MNLASFPSSDAQPATGSELKALLFRFRGAAVSIVLLSVVLNVLALSGSIYLLIIYDRVLVSSSIQTLISVFAILVLLYLFQGVFDARRAQLLQMIGEGFDRALAGRLQRLEIDLAVGRSLPSMPSMPVRDLDQIRAFFLGQGPAALIDLPWILFFLVILWLLHPLLGITTLIGALALAAVTWLNDRGTRDEVDLSNRLGQRRSLVAERIRNNVDAIKGLAIAERMNELVAEQHTLFVRAQTALSRAISKYAALGRGLRMLVQSAVLTAGAILVIRGEASAGIIFAASILAGRALAPVDQAIANWRGLVSARQAWRRLDPLLRAHPPKVKPSVSLEVPRERVEIDRLTIVPPGSERTVVSDITFALKAGDALAVVGPSGSGKSSLSRAIVNIWPAVQGTVRLDGAPLDQFDESHLRAAIGYLPQGAELFAGTVAQNVSRFEQNPPSEQIIAATRAAGIHDLVLSMSDGYDTRVGDGGMVLSAGQRQRVALARALYGDPFLLVLDEPDSNLDPDGELALAAAIAGVRKRGGIVIVVTHRLTLLKEVNAMLVMRDGKQQAFGPRDQVLAALNRKANANNGDGTVVAQPLRKGA